MRTRQKRSSGKPPSKRSPAPGAARYYPAALDVAGRLCLVAGGGKVANRKVSSLLNAGASVKVVSPAITPALARRKGKNGIRFEKRNFRASDLRGAFLVIAATDSEDENARIAELARKKGILVNAVDMPAHCTFIVPSVVKRGPLSIAVSTSGTSPAMARAMRKDLEARYGPQFGRYLRRLARIRREALKQMPVAKERERFLRALASEKIFRALLKGKEPSMPKVKK